MFCYMFYFIVNEWQLKMNLIYLTILRMNLHLIQHKWKAMTTSHNIFFQAVFFIWTWKQVNLVLPHFLTKHFKIWDLPNSSVSLLYKPRTETGWGWGGGVGGGEFALGIHLLPANSNSSEWVFFLNPHGRIEWQILHRKSLSNGLKNAVLPYSRVSFL